MAIYLGTNEVSFAGTNGGFMLNGRLIATKTYSFNLGQTNYSSLTPSTTAQNLTLFTTDYTTTVGTTITCFRLGPAYDGTSIDFNTHDYIVFFENQINYNYGSNNVNSTIHGIRSAHVRDSHEGQYPYSINSSTGKLNNSLTRGSSYITAPTYMLYQKADNTYAVVNGQYGIYHSGSTIVSYSTSTTNHYIELKCGSFSVKANDTYCPADSLSLINPAQTQVQMTWYIYEGDKSMYGNIYTRVNELVANS